MMPACESAGLVIVGDWVTLPAAPLIGQGFGETEIEHLDGAVRTELDVRGLQVAMDDPLRMRRVERVGDLARDR